MTPPHQNVKEIDLLHALRFQDYEHRVFDFGRPPTPTNIDIDAMSDPEGASLKKVLEGDVSLDYAEDGRTVRVFLSSTFTGSHTLSTSPPHLRVLTALTASLTPIDTELERNILIQNAVPKLQAIAQTLGFEFCLSEMRWGITSHAAENHETADICLEEVSNCQRSAAINFVVSVFIFFSSHEAY